MLRKLLAALAVVGLLGGSAPVQAQEALSQGEVTKVDKDAGKLTIKHGPLENLGMPAMTMVFHVADPTMRGEVAPGAKSPCLAGRVGGFLTVTQLHPAQ